VVDRSATGRESKAGINEVEKGAIRRFAEALGETNPIYFEEAAARAAGYRSIVAPPTFPSSLRAGSDLREGLQLSPGKHLLQAEQSFEYARPIVAGDKLTVRSKIIEVAQRQIRSPCHQILPEIPLPVAGAAFVRRQRFEQRVSDPHREAALRLAEHNLGHQRLTTFEHAVSLGDAQRTGSANDLDADQRAAHCSVNEAETVVVGGRKFYAGAIEAHEGARP